MLLCETQIQWEQFSLVYMHLVLSYSLFVLQYSWPARSCILVVIASPIHVPLIQCSGVHIHIINNIIIYTHVIKNNLRTTQVASPASKNCMDASASSTSEGKLLTATPYL